MAAARLLQECGSASSGGGGLDAISPREMEVLKLIGRGLGNREIGELLFIAEPTVKTHVTHLLEKLALRDRTQLAIHAIQQGLLD